MAALPEAARQRLQERARLELPRAGQVRGGARLDRGGARGGGPEDARGVASSRRTRPLRPGAVDARPRGPRRRRRRSTRSSAGPGGAPRAARARRDGFADVTEKAGLAGVAGVGGGGGGLRQRRPAGPPGPRRRRALALFHNEGGGRFKAETAPRLPAWPHPAATAAFVDIDHDGDLDVFVGRPRDGAAGPALLLRNNGDRTFTDITAQRAARRRRRRGRGRPDRLRQPPRHRPLRPAATTRPALFKNMRDGSFSDVAAEVGPRRRTGPFRCAAAGDVNKDGYTDFFLGADGRVLARPERRPRGVHGGARAAGGRGRARRAARRLRQRRPPRPARGDREGAAAPAQPRRRPGPT